MRERNFLFVPVGWEFLSREARHKNNENALWQNDVVVCLPADYFNYMRSLANLSFSLPTVWICIIIIIIVMVVIMLVLTMAMAMAMEMVFVHVCVLVFYCVFFSSLLYRPTKMTFSIDQQLQQNSEHLHFRFHIKKIALDQLDELCVWPLKFYKIEICSIPMLAKTNFLQNVRNELTKPKMLTFDTLLFCQM